MPTPTPPSPGPSAGPALRRRTALGGLVLASGALTACTRGLDVRKRPRVPTPSPSADPDVALAAAALASERAVLDLVDRTLARHPDLAEPLSGTRSVHEAHVRLLVDAAPDEPGTGRSPSPESSASTPDGTGLSDLDSPSSLPSGPAPEAVPRQPDRALVAVARAEDELSVAAKRNAFAAESGAFARVLASTAAAAAQQASVLRGAAARAGTGGAS